jgi:16S rRNA (uracil1498-N3)-methyltransferase
LADRFFSELPLALGRVRLEEPESHHLIHVLRAKPGLEVVLFDGSGAEFAARVEQVERSAVGLAVYERRENDRESRVRVTLGVALPKGDRQKWLVEKATELGVARLTPLETTRGVAQPVGAALVRFERAVIEASKQCGRNRLMEIAAPRPWGDFTSEPAPTTALRLVAHPGGKSIHEALPESRTAGEVWLAVGPEGGWTDDEIEVAIRAGWQVVGLGRRLLRTETAAIALAAQFLTLP